LSSGFKRGDQNKVEIEFGEKRERERGGREKRDIELSRLIENITKSEKKNNSKSLKHHCLIFLDTLVGIYHSLDLLGKVH